MLNAINAVISPKRRQTTLPYHDVKCKSESYLCSFGIDLTTLQLAPIIFYRPK